LSPSIISLHVTISCFFKSRRFLHNIRSSHERNISIIKEKFPLLTCSYSSTSLDASRLNQLSNCFTNRKTFLTSSLSSIPLTFCRVTWLSLLNVQSCNWLSSLPASSLITSILQVSFYNILICGKIPYNQRSWKSVIITSNSRFCQHYTW
jgi:hypothetical protein